MAKTQNTEPAVVNNETAVVVVTYKDELAKIDALLADTSFAMLHAELNKSRSNIVKKQIRTLQADLKALRAMLPAKQARKPKA